MAKNVVDKQKTSVTVIKSFKQLKDLMEVPVQCRFELDGHEIQLPCHRLMPAVQEQVLQLLREAQPPFKRERGPNGDYDFQNPAYQAAREKNSRIARALVVYTGCPTIAAEKPGLTDRNQIYEFIQGLLPEMIIEVISLTIQKGGIDVRERADFTSTPASEI